MKTKTCIHSQLSWGIAHSTKLDTRTLSSLSTTRLPLSVLFDVRASTKTQTLPVESCLHVFRTTILLLPNVSTRSRTRIPAPVTPSPTPTLSLTT